MGAGRGATNTAYSRPLTQHTSHVTINTGEYITSHRELSPVWIVCFFACHTLPRALWAVFTLSILLSSTLGFLLVTLV